MSLALLSAEEIARIGFLSAGQDVRIHRTAVFFGAERIALGSHVRIDAYAVLSAGAGGIRIGDYVHLAVGVTILGQGPVTIEDFCGLSAKVAVFSSTDDYTDGSLTNPTVPDRFRRIFSAPVLLEKHAIVGACSVIMPGTTLGFGSAVGALSYVRKPVPSFAIVSGNPLRRVGVRSAALLDAEKALRLADGSSPA